MANTARYMKPKMICPVCKEMTESGAYRTFSVTGMPMHIRMKHPEHDTFWKEHRDQLINRFSCDEDGKPTSGQPLTMDFDDVVAAPEPDVEPIVTPEPEPEPEPDPDPEPEPEPVDLQKEEFRDDRKTRTGFVYNPYGY